MLVEMKREDDLRIRCGSSHTERAADASRAYSWVHTHTSGLAAGTSVHHLHHLRSAANQ